MAARPPPTQPPPASPSRRARCAPSASGPRTTKARLGCWSSASSRAGTARLPAALSGSPAGPFRPSSPTRFYETPAFYLGNHTAMLADGEQMPWPGHTGYLDFELELAFVLARPLADATPAEAREAIGGWFVLNDWSARDVQAEEVRHGVFGPAVKSKTFANSIGRDVLSADELPDWQAVDRAGAGRRRGLVRGRHGGGRPRRRRDARPRLRRRATRRRRHSLDRDDARLLRARARPLDPAGADGRAGDRRDRNPDQPDRRATSEEAARRRIGPRPARPQRLRDPRRGRPRLRALHRPPRRLRALGAPTSR